MPVNLREILAHGFEESLVRRMDLSDTLLVVLSAETFANCRNLEEIVLPVKLERIEELCFAGCYRLEKIEFPLSLVELGSMVFYNCYSLKGIVLSAFLMKLGMKVFVGCLKVREILIMGKKRFNQTDFETYQRIRYVDQGEVIQQNE
jgi:hypothetical protein